MSTSKSQPEPERQAASENGAGRMTVGPELLIEAIEAANSSIIVTNPQREDNPIVYANSGFFELTGYSRDEVIGRNCRFLQYRPDGLRDDDQDGVHELRAAVEGEEYANVVLRNYKKDGTPFWNDLYITPVHRDGDLVAFIGVQNDVTPRVEAQNELQVVDTERRKAEAERAFLERALENTTDSVVITKADLDAPGPEIVYVNKAFEQLTGYSPDEAVGKTPRILQGPRTNPAILERLRRDLDNERSFEGEAINYRKDGSEYIVNWRIRPITNEQDEVAYWISAQRDVTERRRLEREVLDIQSTEQQRIARELHDSIQQRFSTLVTLGSLIRTRIEKGQSIDDKHLDMLDTIARKGMRETRAIAHGLAPVDLQRSGLMTALQHLVETTQSIYKIECSFTYEEPVLIKHHNTAVHLYRIAQEAISNAIRHGEANHIWVGLSRTGDGRVELSVRDDGKGLPDEVLDQFEHGIDPDPEGETSSKAAGLGLNTMQYRADHIDGTLIIQRGAEGGTVVRCQFDPTHDSVKL